MEGEEASALVEREAEVEALVEVPIEEPKLSQRLQSLPNPLGDLISLIGSLALRVEELETQTEGDRQEWKERIGAHEEKLEQSSENLRRKLESATEHISRNKSISEHNAAALDNLIFNLQGFRQCVHTRTGARLDNYYPAPISKVKVQTDVISRWKRVLKEAKFRRLAGRVSLLHMRLKPAHSVVQRLETLEAQLTSLDSRIISCLEDARKKNEEDNQETITFMKSEVLRLEDRCSQLEAKNDHLQQTCEQLQLRVESSEMIGNQIEGISGDVSATMDKLEKVEKELNDFQSDEKEFSNDIQTRIHEIQNDSASFHSAASGMNRLYPKVQNLEDTLMQVKNDLSRLKSHQNHGMMTITAAMRPGVTGSGSDLEPHSEVAEKESDGMASGEDPAAFDPQSLMSAISKIGKIELDMTKINGRITHMDDAAQLLSKQQTSFFAQQRSFEGRLATKLDEDALHEAVSSLRGDILAMSSKKNGELEHAVAELAKNKADRKELFRVWKGMEGKSTASPFQVDGPQKNMHAELVWKRPEDVEAQRSLRVMVRPKSASELNRPPPLRAKKPQQLESTPPVFEMDPRWKGNIHALESSNTTVTTNQRTMPVLHGGLRNVPVTAPGGTVTSITVETRTRPFKKPLS